MAAFVFIFCMVGHRAGSDETVAPTPLIIEIASPVITYPGTHTISINVRNNTKKGINLYTEITCNNEPEARDSAQVFRKVLGKGQSRPASALLIAKASKSVPPGLTRWKFDIDYVYDMGRVLYISVYEGRNKQPIERLGPVLINFQPNVTRMRRFRKILERVRPRFGPAVEFRSSMKDELEKIELLARTPMDADKWSQIAHRLDILSSDVNSLLFSGSDKSRIGYWAAIASTLSNITRWDVFPGSLRGPISMSGCRGESESAQLVLSAYGKTIENVGITISDLQGTGESKIYWNQITYRFPDFGDDSAPGQLPPDRFNHSSTLTLPKGALRSVWITVRIPKDAKPGLYTGVLQINPPNARSSNRPIELKVWDFDMPKRRSFNAIMAYDEKSLSSWYGGNTQRNRAAFYSMMLEMGISPLDWGSPYPRPDMEELRGYSEQGLKFVSTGSLGVPEGETEQVYMDSYVRRARRYMEFPSTRKLDFTPITISRVSNAAEERSLLGYLRQMISEVVRIRQTPPTQGLLSFVNTWAPSPVKYDSTAPYQPGLGSIWWTLDSTSVAPYPSLQPNSTGLQTRMLGWLAWKYNLGGIIFSGSGENGLSLFYPAESGKPEPSIRLQHLRDAMDDWQYLIMLKDLSDKVAKNNTYKSAGDLSKALKLLAVPSEMVESVSSYCSDPEEMEEFRTAVGETIESLIHAIPSEQR
jgi:hypothetical protein